jgi:hypothetical protein
MMPLDVLKGSPFKDFLIPGIILFIFVGIIPVAVAWGLLKKGIWTGLEALNPFKKYFWAWTASWVSGIIILIWVTTETVLLGYISPLQPFIMVWGLALILLTLLPRMRNWYIKKS